MIVELVALVVILFILSYFYWTKNYKYWESRGVPCMPAEFPWGSLRGLDPFKKNISYFLQTLYDLHDEPLIGFYGPTEPCLLVKDLDMVKSVLVTDFKSFHNNGYHTYGSIDPMMRYNAFCTESMDEWKTIRGIHSPLFTLNKIKTAVPEIEEISKTMVEYVHQHRSDGIDAKLLSVRFAVDNVLKVGFDFNNNSFKDDDREQFPLARPEVFFGTEWSSNAAGYSAFFLPWLSLVLRCRTIGKKGAKMLTEWGNSLVDQRKGGNNTRVDVIQRMILKMEKDKQQNIPEMTDEVKAAQYMTFIMDGFETSSNALTNALYDIASHASVQQRLRQEILAEGDCIDDFTRDKIQSLKYLDDCVMESLRLRTPLPVLTRRCTEETSLGSLTIQKGIKVFIPIQAIQTDPNYFPDPLSYNPDRFGHEDASKHPALYSFGGGPRICLGMRYAEMYLKIAIISLLLKFKISALNDVELESYFFFSVSKPVYLKFEPL